MTSLKASLPPEGSAVWRKDRASFRRTSSNESENAPVVKHVVIREVWQKNFPTRHALYKIDVMTKSNHWFVLRRFKEFNELHKKLVGAYGVPKDMLPPKKLTANMSLQYLEKRRQALEHYLQRLVNSSTYVSTCPEIFDFLDVRSHDVLSVTKSLAKELFTSGDAILASDEEFVLSPTQLYCITRQLQLPEPGQTVEEQLPADLGHLYSFIYHLEKLCVSSLLAKPASCQELANHLEFDISLFKALKSFRLEGLQVSLVSGLPAVKLQLNSVAVRYCLKTMKEFLLDCAQEKRSAPKAKGSVASWRSQAASRLAQNRVIVQPWVNLTNLDLSNNKIAYVDSSLKLLPVLQQLNLSYNEFVLLDLQQICCPTLTHLNLAHNEIHFVSGTSRDLRHLKSLVLNHNKMQTLNGLESLPGLIELNLSNNDISNLQEVEKLMVMSQLKYLLLAGNQCCKSKYHRQMVLAYFKGREVVLDNQPMTAREREKLRTLPTRIRASTSPVQCSRPNDQEVDFMPGVRPHSFDEFNLSPGSVSTSDNDSQDSGIDRNSSLRSEAATVDEDLDDSRQRLEGLDFSWTYFESESTTDNAAQQSACSQDRAAISCAIEEQGVVESDHCDSGGQTLTESLEIAHDVISGNGDERVGNLGGESDTVPMSCAEQHHALGAGHGDTLNVPVVKQSQSLEGGQDGSGTLPAEAQSYPHHTH